MFHSMRHAQIEIHFPNFGMQSQVLDPRMLCSEPLRLTVGFSIDEAKCTSARAGRPAKNANPHSWSHRRLKEPAWVVASQVQGKSCSSHEPIPTYLLF